MAAGSAEGIGVWDLTNVHSTGNDIFRPAISEDERDMKYSRWKMAIERSLGWVDDEKNTDMYEEDKQQCILSSLPAAMFIITAIGFLLLARQFGS